MRLTQHTDYALRMLIQAAVRHPERIRVAEVSSSFGISAAHLNKVAQTLAAAGFLETVRGRGGGLRLRRPLNSIRVGDVVRATEPDFQIVECFGSASNPAEPEGRDGCPIIDGCLLRGSLHRAFDAFMRELDAITLADLAKPKQQLLRILQSS